ncbi:MAG: ABC transporter permease [Acidobacteria bacterium]|nr:ABC transporter permease [Acidobacteriota bacterium]
MVSLWWRELLRFARQRSRIVGLLAAPLLFWLLIGSGLGASFQPPSATDGTGYLQYFFPGTVVMVVLFASIFSNMSVIEDRHEGFLLSVLVAPIARASLVLGKVLGGTTQAVLPGFLFLLAGPMIGFTLRPLQMVALGGILFLISFSLTSLGFLIAWWMDSVQGFHAVLNLVLLPMWMLSGALFPASGASAWVRWVMALNPLTYGVAALRRVLYGQGIVPGSDVAPLGLSLEITVLFGLLTVAAALIWSGRASVRQLS